MWRQWRRLARPTPNKAIIDVAKMICTPLQCTGSAALSTRKLTIDKIAPREDSPSAALSVHLVFRLGVALQP
jgi:hypothetical protein